VIHSLHLHEAVLVLEVWQSALRKVLKLLPFYFECLNTHRTIPVRHILGFKLSQPKISVRSTKERGAGHMTWLSEVSAASLLPDSAELLKLPYPSSCPLNPDIKGYSIFASLILS
jgi:hypothetical protein